MFSTLWNIFFFLLALTILIFVHEFGHFAAARLCKIKVLRFSIGFGPILFRRQGKDGCEYALSAIPLGGYVKMLGENAQEGANNDEQSFQSKSVLQRALVIGAGPLFNILLAVVLYTFINISGVNIVKPVVGDVIPSSEADLAKLNTYDLIKSVDGNAVNSWSDVVISLIPYAGTNAYVNFIVSGNFGADEERSLNLSMHNLEVNQHQNPLESLGIRPCNGKIVNVLTYVDPQGAAYKAGIREGDSIVEVNGVKTDSWYRVADNIAKSSGAVLDLAIKRDGKIYAAQVIPAVRYDKQQNRNIPFIGVGVGIESIPSLVTNVKYAPIEALIKGLKDTYDMSKLVAISASKLISGSISADNISGPISIAKGAGQSADIGLIFFISFLAAISVNLGIFNLLPIPVLDGGQLLFLCYEAIMHHPPSARVQYFLTSVGFAILIALMMFAVLNDIKGL